MDFPGGGEEGVDVVRGEEIGGAVRAVEDADLPVVSQRRRQRFGVGRTLRRGDVQHIARPERGRVAAEFAQDEGARLPR